MNKAGKPSAIPELDRSALPGPESIERRVLANGVVVLSRENFASPSVVFSGYLPVGALLEPAEQAGLASLTASALMRGTQKRSFNEIYQSIESIGANLSIGAGTHFTSFQGKSLAEDLSMLLGLLADVLRRPRFPENQVEQLRGERLTSLALRDQDTRSMASMTFEELTYPDHPYRFPSNGYRHTVAELKPGDLRDFHRQHYRPAGMVVSVVGAVEASAALDTVEAVLADWNPEGDRSTLDIPDAGPPEGTVRRQVHLAGKSQADIVLGAPGPPRKHDLYLAAAVGNSILGRFGLYGRVGDSVREAAGLAYYAYSSISGGLGPSPWKVTAGVNPANIERAIELVVQEIRRFSSEPVDEEELSDNQAHYIGRLPLQLESNEGVAGALTHLERYDLGLDYYQRYPDLIQAVTREQILEVAGEHLDPKRLAIGVAGPQDPS